VGLVVFVFWRGWLQFNVANKGDETETKLTIHKEKIKEDIDALKNREHQVVSKASDEKAETTIQGRVQTLAGDHLTLLTSDGQTMKVDLAPETTIRVGERDGTRTDLHVGDAVTVTQVTRQDRLVASKVTVQEHKE
jgi:hypothetical protein